MTPLCCALWLLLAPAEVPVAETDATTKQVDGYRGTWFNLGQVTPGYGPKYSGGLGTYTANHRPLAVYAAAVDKTFFTYGGADPSGDLCIMVSYYDHARDVVPRPTQVMRWLKYNDPHCNACVSLDGAGYVWLFVSGRGRGRAGYKFRSRQPYDLTAFEPVRVEEMTYPQAWYQPEVGFFHLFTKYTKGRELYFETSNLDGTTWTDDQKLAGFGGHYQNSTERDGRLATAFNYHPGGNVDQRTNLYYCQTIDRGRTWTNAAGEVLTLPLDQVANPALVHDYAAEKLLCYGMDLVLDDQGRPSILYLTSRDWRAGPTGDPRTWRVATWTGAAWRISDITTSDHNYDTGSLWIEGDEWVVMGPTDPGPQPWGCGGEVVRWVSRDGGVTWRRDRQVTTGSARNQTFQRQPRGARDPFFAFWADGNPLEKSVSRLYFVDSTGTRVRQLPDQMTVPEATPQPLSP